MRAAVATLVVACSLGLASASLADNYGRVTPRVKAQVIALIHRTFDRYGVGDFMLCVVRRESGFAPTAANWRDSHGGSFGLWQINAVWSPRGYVSRSDPVSMAWVHRMFDPQQNAAVALALYRRSGTGPWRGHCG